MSGEDEIMSGDGWQTVPKARLTDADYDAARQMADPIPEADWFWGPILRWCVPACCDLDAFDLSPDFVRWVTHQSTEKPERDNWRYEDIGDLQQLVSDLRSSAASLKLLDVSIVYSKSLGLYCEPLELAEILDELAEVVDDSPLS